MGHESRSGSGLFKEYVKQKASGDQSFKIEMNTYTEQVKGLANKYLQGEEWMYRGVTIPPQAVEGLVQHYFHQPETSSSSSSPESMSLFGSLTSCPFAGTISESEIRKAHAMMASLKKKARKKLKKMNRTKKQRRRKRPKKTKKKTRKK